MGGWCWWVGWWWVGWWWVVGGGWWVVGGGLVARRYRCCHPQSAILTFPLPPVAQWSHNFRPSYLRLGDVIGWLQPTSVLALTATAPARVAADVCRKLRIPYRTTPDPTGIRDVVGGDAGGGAGAAAGGGASLEASNASSTYTVHRVGGHAGWQRDNLCLSVVNAPNEDNKVRPIPD